jgi:chemotaxis protein methyltransferase CheR
MTQLANSHFAQIQEIAKDLWGLHLTERKRQLVSSRLTKFLRKSPFATVDAYLDHLTHSATEEDALLFFDVLSTNVTSFFREPEAFAYLERAFYTPLDRGTITLPGRKIRIWSAACSTGPEPYSLAIHALEHLPSMDQWDFKILATDLANSALRTATQGVYDKQMLDRMDAAMVRKYFTPKPPGQRDRLAVIPKVRGLVSIAQLNLMEAWPMKGPFDIIFLRNVMIYFDKPTRDRLIQRMYDLLRPGGVFVVGSAETLSGCSTPFRTAQPSVYVK